MRDYVALSMSVTSNIQLYRKVNDILINSQHRLELKQNIKSLYFNYITSSKRLKGICFDLPC